MRARVRIAPQDHTLLEGHQIADIVPTFAKELKRFGLLRGWNPKNGSHGTADQYVMSGRNFNQAIHYPTYGSVASYFHGFKSALPPFGLGFCASCTLEPPLAPLGPTDQTTATALDASVKATSFVRG